MTNRIIYYYQTFTGLKPILNKNIVTHIHLSSIHFGTNSNNTPYIHLNNNEPSNPIFYSLWDDIEECYKKGIKVILMVGGAGGAFNALFGDFDTYYPMLRDMLKSYCFNGIDLDIEELVDINNVKKLINQIKKDFKDDFIITMAPLQSSMSNDNGSMGGFIYKDLYNSDEGKYIDYFNTQSYYSYTFDDYDAMIKNGYPPEKIVFGMISSEFNSSNMNDACDTIKQIKQKYKDFGGVFVWEYCDCPPNNLDHSEWAQLMYDSINQNITN